MVQIDGKNYFVLSAYFIDTRILLDMLTESVNNVSFGINDTMPQTLEEDLLFHFKQMKAWKGGNFVLLINGKEHSLVGGGQGNLNKELIKINVELPEEFIGKRLDLIKYEFKQLEEEIEINEMSLIKKIDSKQYLIQQKHAVPIEIGADPFIFTYSNTQTNDNSKIIIRELFYEDISEDRRSLFNCKKNEKMLWGAISADKDMRELEIFTEKRLKGGINYTMSPVMPIYRTQNPNDENLIDHKLYLGFMEPEERDVDLVLFSITKKTDVNHIAVLLQKNK